jgi:uncharacterized membrane protein
MRRNDIIIGSKKSIQPTSLAAVLALNEKNQTVKHLQDRTTTQQIAEHMMHSSF